MKIENSTKETRLDFFRTLYERAQTSAQQTVEECDKNMRQYMGDTAIDGSREAALTVRNITYEIVESQVSSDIPMPKGKKRRLYREALSGGENATALRRA